jgi:D-alanine-D-alanine ligase
MRIGILMGGASREREVSFAGGRTVYDNLDRRFFRPVPLFVDSFNAIVRLRPALIYKGAIRDFYPLPDAVPRGFPLARPYIEHLCRPYDEPHVRSMKAAGEPVPLDRLSAEVDAVFLCLHGDYGEDGSVQGMLEWMGIPYTGSGLFGSAMCMDKVHVRRHLAAAGFATPRHVVLSARAAFDALNEGNDDGDVSRLFRRWVETLADEVKKSGIEPPFVLKHPRQGSSIGVAPVRRWSDFADGVRTAGMMRVLENDTLPDDFFDLRTGVGGKITVLDEGKWRNESVVGALLLPRPLLVAAEDAPEHIIVEEFLDGPEFSVVVVEGTDGRPFALPPTAIRKYGTMYDYRGKYLPGMAGKKTPPDFPADQIRRLMREAENLKTFLGAEVYARLDGIIGPDGRPYFNDPNTTSGMNPSSFFFHQAAEVGFSPKNFLTHVIRTSLARRLKIPVRFEAFSAHAAPKETVAVILGGVSTERHISVESGRNVFQKLSGSERYEPVPYFLAGDMTLWRLPVHILLKDNADDIATLVSRPYREDHADLLASIREAAQRQLGVGKEISFVPRAFRVEELKEDFVFIALHGRPGEDGTLQAMLEAAGKPYNGSGVAACALCMDKYRTNAFLAERGFRVPKNVLAQKRSPLPEILDDVERLLGYPVVAKPQDEGCSSAVVKINDRNELETYLRGTFRESPELDASIRQALGLAVGAPFPAKDTALIEEYVGPKPGWMVKEVTVGFYTQTTAHGVEYRVFPPSETPSAGSVLSLEEKFLAGEGQNLTPPTYGLARNGETVAQTDAVINDAVRQCVGRAARALNLHGYARLDAFVRLEIERFLSGQAEPEVVFIEVNALPGMTPATAIFHQCLADGLSPLRFIETIIAEGKAKARVAV